MRKLLLVAVIIILGLSQWALTFHLDHPDTDELFELRNMQGLKSEAVLSNKSFYGDHTSFPGEYLLHAPIMAALGMFSHPMRLDYESNNVDLKRWQFWTLSAPKVLITILAMGCFVVWLITLNLGLLGWVVGLSVFLFNQHLVYAAFSLRPYGVLPELLILNCFFARQEDKSFGYGIGYGILVFFTCIYHAYGILIAELPLLFFRNKRVFEFHLINVLAMAAWAYYASYSNFGIHPNIVQSVADPFAVMKKDHLFEAVLKSLFSTSLMTQACLPFVILGLTKLNLKGFLFLLTFVIIPLTLIIFVDIKTNYVIYPRQYVWIVPALAIWCAITADRGIRFFNYYE